MPPLAGEQAGRLLATMWRIRLFEERVGRLTRDGEVHGLIHLSTGQEGVAVGVCAQLRADDAVYSGHRGHGHAIAKGAPLEQTMAELMGRDAGLCRGLGGSMHLVDVEHGFLGATGVVGGNIPIALGSALAARLRGDDAVAVVFFGDGAVQAGHFNETINLASLWKLPSDPRVREQRLCGVHASFGPHHDRTGQRCGRAVRRRARHRRRQRRARRVGCLRGLSRLRAQRRRPVPARMPDRPPRRALRGRCGQVSRGHRGCRMAGPGSDPPAPAPRSRGGVVRRG